MEYCYGVDPIQNDRMASILEFLQRCRHLASLLKTIFFVTFTNLRVCIGYHRLCVAGVRVSTAPGNTRNVLKFN